MKPYIAAAFALQMLCHPAQAQLYPIPNDMPPSSRDFLIWQYEQAQRAHENYEQWLQQQHQLDEQQRRQPSPWSPSYDPYPR